MDLEAEQKKKRTGKPQIKDPNEIEELFGKDAVMINEDFAINEGPQAHYDKKNNKNRRR